MAIGATGCGSGDESAAPVAEPCSVTSGSGEVRLLHKLLGTDQVETTSFENTSDLVDRLLVDLRGMTPGKATSTVDACRFKPGNGTGSNSARLEFYWVPKDFAGRVLPGTVGRYDVNGVKAQANDVSSQLRVPCTLPGADGKASHDVLLQAELSNTVLMGTKVAPETKEQQISLTYLMTRRVADALGCEGDPLRKDPVVRSERASS